MGIIERHTYRFDIFSNLEEKILEKFEKNLK